MSSENEQQQQTVSLPPVRPLTQDTITQILVITTQWMGDVLNPNRDDDFRSKMKALISSSIDGICDSGGGGGGGQPCPDLPTEGKPQPEKNGNKDANTWKTTKMVGLKYKGQYKVVDNMNVNIAVEFKSEKTAQQYIDHYKCEQSRPKVTKAIIKPVPPQIPTGGTFTLDGSSSIAAADVKIINYAWTQTKGTTVVIPAPTSATTGITTGDVEEQLEFSLTVTDDKAGTDTATITVNVSNATPTPTPTPSPTPTPIPGDKDPEGIAKIYPDDQSKIQTAFYLHKDGNSSARLGGKGDRKVLADGSIQITPTSSTHPATARIYIRTPDGSSDYNAQLAAGGNDWKKMLSRADKDGVNRGGWMMTANDFREVEATHYYKIPKIVVDDEMTCYVGGGHPSDDAFPLQCISSCYKAQIQTKDLSPRAALEMDHFDSPSDYCWNDTVKEKFSLKDALGASSLAGKIIGQKYMRWNEVKNGEVVAVHQELWLDLGSKDLPTPDLSKQNWQFWVEYVHHKSPDDWPSKPKHMDYQKGCNAEGITFPCFGAPVYGMRFDESPWIMYYLSVRPIIPQK